MSMDEESDKALKEIAKIKPEHWKRVNETLTTIKGFIDVDANDAFKSMTEGVIETASLKFQEVMAPLKNELNALFNDLLQPFLPMVQEIVQFVLPLVQWVADVIIDVRNFLMGGLSGTSMAIIEWMEETGGIGGIRGYIDWAKLKEARASQAARRLANKRIGGLTRAQTLF